MHRIKNILVALSLVTAFGFTNASVSAPGSGLPNVVSVDPGLVKQGDTVLVTVGLDSAPDTDETITISSSNSSCFSSLPSTVTALQGETSVCFYATISTTAYGMPTVSASAQGLSVMSNPIPIQ